MFFNHLKGIHIDRTNLNSNITDNIIANNGSTGIYIDGGVSSLKNYDVETFKLYYQHYGFLKAIHYSIVIKDIKVILFFFDKISYIKSKWFRQMDGPSSVN